MSVQLDLFAWADARPSNVIDVVPALIRKAEVEEQYQIPRPKRLGAIIELRRTA